jgi:hypothetical protein
MVELFTRFWWLIFPLAGFAFAGFNQWLLYRRSRAALEVLKTYAAQGKEPPPELMRALGGADFDADQPKGRNGELKGAVMTLAVAAGFVVAAIVMPGASEPFFMVAAIMAAIGVGLLILAAITRRER